MWHPGKPEYILRSTMGASLGLLSLLFDQLWFIENYRNASLPSHQLRHVLPEFLFVGRQVCISLSSAAFIDHVSGSWSQCCCFFFFPFMLVLLGKIAPSFEPSGEGVGLRSGGLPVSVGHSAQKQRSEVGWCEKINVPGKNNVIAILWKVVMLSG